MKHIINFFKYFLRIVSNDPAASCSRTLAIGVIFYVGYMGMKHWSTMTQVQVTFLLGYLSGLLPYVTGKLFEKLSDVISAIKGNSNEPLK